MLLRILSPVIHFALWVFFRKIDVKGREHVPGNRRLIFVANHPNVMLDSLLLGACVPGKTPFFLGKSTLFKNRLYAFFLRRLGVIPVSRSQDADSKMARNQDMLLSACQTLKQGNSLALFPEGHSHANLKVHPLKSGAARIALRVEDELDGQGDVCIIPVGLAYTAPAIFRSDVAVHFGPPIEVQPFLSAYRTNHQAGARELTDLIHQHLAALTWHVDDATLESVIRDLSAVYGDRIARGIPDSATHSNALRTGQELIQAVEHFSRTNPPLVSTFASRLRAYRRKLRRLRLQETMSQSLRTSHLLFGLLLAPFALYGFLNNALPYFLPLFFTRPRRRTPEMIGTVKLTVGAAAFPLYYLIRSVVAGLAWGWPCALLYGCSLPLSGLFTLFYHEHFLQRLPLWQSAMQPCRRRHYLKRISAERAQLIGDLDAVRQNYQPQAVQI